MKYILITIFFITVTILGSVHGEKKSEELTPFPTEQQVIEVFDRIRISVKSALKALFNSVRGELKTIFQNLFGLVTVLVPGNTQIQLDELGKKLKAIENPSLKPVFKALLEQLNIHYILFTEKAVPIELLTAKINVDSLLKNFHGKSIALSTFLDAIGAHLAEFYTPSIF